MNTNLENIEDVDKVLATLDENFNTIIDGLQSSSEDNKRFGEVEPPKEVRRNKVPNKRDKKIINKVWGEYKEKSRKTFWVKDSSTGEGVLVNNKCKAITRYIKHSNQGTNEEKIAIIKEYFEKNKEKYENILKNLRSNVINNNKE